MLCEHVNYLLNDSSIMEQLHYQEFDDGSFYLGFMQNSQREGYGINYHNSNHFYFGEWHNNSYNGKGFLFQANYCHYGDFLNGKRHGEGIIVGKNMYVDADFDNNNISRVKNTLGGFTYNGKIYDENGKSSNKSFGFGGCISIVFTIVLFWGIFSYCSSWLKTQNSDDHNKTELYCATTTYICTAKKSLKVRTKPAVSSSQIGSIMAGEEVEVYEIIDGFARIRYNDNDGYVSIRYLKKK